MLLCQPSYSIEQDSLSVEGESIVENGQYSPRKIYNLLSFAKKDYKKKELKQLESFIIGFNFISLFFAFLRKKRYKRKEKWRKRI